MTVWARQAFALIIGALSGWAGQAAGLPLPWMLGPMLGCGLAAGLGAPVTGPVRLRPLVIPVIGVMLGSGVTAELFADAGRWVVTLGLLIPFLIVTAALSYGFYRRVGGFDRVTAYFCAMPGGLNEMVIAGAEAGGDERRIALAHSIRVFVVIVFVVLLYGLVLDVSAGDRASQWVSLGALSVSDWLILGACAVAGPPLAGLIRLPAAQVFGPMILSAVVHFIGLVTVAPPSLLVIVAQVVIGTVLGSRFAGMTGRAFLRDLGLAVGSTSVMILTALGFAALIAVAGDAPLSQAFLAFSPGGLTEMSLLALAMGQDAAYVSIVHVTRIALVIAGAGLFFRRFR